MDNKIIDTIQRNTAFRYERKFTAQAIYKAEIEEVIKNHPANFREIFEARQVNNIYLDTLGLKFYKDNKIGVSARKKVRIRWYGQTWGAVEKPKLEYKIKAGQLGQKWVYDLPPLVINEQFSSNGLFSLLIGSSLPKAIKEDLRRLKPSLLNSYRRKYFLSSDGHFRLTLDDQLDYYRIDRFANLFIEKHRQEREYIIELKYTPEHDDTAQLIAGKFSFRLDKSSKYVNGVDWVKVRRAV